MSRFLDTTVLIDVLRGRPAGDRVRALRAARAVPTICAVNVDELWRGVRTHEEGALRAFVGGLDCVPLGVPEGERAGRWRREFAARGVSLSQADCLIAAAALTAGLPLATGNPTHFPMPELQVEHWPAGA